MPESLLPLVVGLVFLLAGFVKGMVGLGLPTVAMGLLGLVIPPMEAAALLIVPSLVTNLWQLSAGPRLVPLLRRFWPLLAGVCAGTAAGMECLPVGTGVHATVALGLALAAYAGLGLAKIRFPVPSRAETVLSPAVGAVTGLVTAATGVFVVPAVPFLQAIDLGTEDLVQALGLSFTVSTLALAAGLGFRDALPPSLAGASLLALAPAVAGMFGGRWLRRRVEPEMFRRCFLAGLVLLGLALALRG
jgi:uncharacterized membrane protein YfcA